MKRLTIIGAIAALGGGIVAWFGLGSLPRPPIGPLILLALLAVVLRSTQASTRALAVVGMWILLVMSPSGEGRTDANEVLVNVGRSLQLVGTLSVTAGLLARRTWRRTVAEPEIKELRQRRAFPTYIVVLVVLSAMFAELLTAYSDSTGNPGALAFALVFFACLYGCPALLIREVARRRGLGWRGIVLLAGAFGLMQAGIIDQTLFQEQSGDVDAEYWENSLRPTFIEPLGISAYMTQLFLVGHVVFSFSAPIALTEALFPRVAAEPWLRRRGIAIAIVLYLATACIIFGDAITSADVHTSPMEFACAVLVVSGLVMMALRSRPWQGPKDRQSPSVVRVLIVSLVAGLTYAMMPEIWIGVAIDFAVIVGAVLALRRFAGIDWGLRHIAALVAGPVLARALLAFTYYPVVGNVEAFPKYAHNVVMLIIVVAVIALALKPKPANPMG